MVFAIYTTSEPDTVYADARDIRQAATDAHRRYGDSVTGIQVATSHESARFHAEHVAMMQRIYGAGRA